MQIRPFGLADEPTVVALWKACGLTRPWNDPHKDIARKLAVQPELFLVGGPTAVIASVMAGYEGHREHALLERGCPKVNLQVRASNPDAVAFYRRLGYLQDESISLGKRLVVD